MYLISWLFILVWNPELSIEVLSFGQKEATPIFLLNPWWGIYAHNNLVHPEGKYQIPGINYNNPIIYNIIKWYNYWTLWCELRKYKFKWWCDCCSCNSNLTNFKLTWKKIFHSFHELRQLENRPLPSSKTLAFKMRLGAQPFLWKWVLFAWEWKIISISKAEHLPSFRNRGPGATRKWSIDPLTMCVGLHSSVGRALQRYRRSHVFECSWPPVFFSV